MAKAQSKIRGRRKNRSGETAPAKTTRARGHKNANKAISRKSAVGKPGKSRRASTTRSLLSNLTISRDDGLDDRLEHFRGDIRRDVRQMLVDFRSELLAEIREATHGNITSEQASELLVDATQVNKVRRTHEGASTHEAHSVGAPAGNNVRTIVGSSHGEPQSEITNERQASRDDDATENQSPEGWFNVLFQLGKENRHTYLRLLWFMYEEKAFCSCEGLYEWGSASSKEKHKGKGVALNYAAMCKARKLLLHHKIIDCERIAYFATFNPGQQYQKKHKTPHPKIGVPQERTEHTPGCLTARGEAIGRHMERIQWYTRYQSHRESLTTKRRVRAARRSPLNTSAASVPPHAPDPTKAIERETNTRQDRGGTVPPT